jgi:hypothetical protein
MPSNVTHYEFGAFRLEPRERRLSRDGDPIAIPPKAAFPRRPSSGFQFFKTQAGR